MIEKRKSIGRRLQDFENRNAIDELKDLKEELQLLKNASFGEDGNNGFNSKIKGLEIKQDIILKNQDDIKELLIDYKQSIEIKLEKAEEKSEKRLDKHIKAHFAWATTILGTCISFIGFLYTHINSMFEKLK